MGEVTGPEPLVSVIVIVLDGERFLGEAIDSVQQQSYPRWELLVVDDGSTDGTLELAARRAADDPRIRVLRHPDLGNHGMSASRNLGLAEARGALIGFLDADDVWEPGKLGEQVELLRADPTVGLVYGRTLVWHRWRPEGPPDFFYDLGVAPDAAYDPPVLFDQLVDNRCQTPTTCNALFRRSVVERVGGFEPSFRGMFEDQVFFAKVLLEHRAHVSDRCWARYRQHPASASALAGEHDVASRVRFLLWLRGYLRRAGAATPAQRRHVERVLVRELSGAGLGAARAQVARLTRLTRRNR